MKKNFMFYRKESVKFFRLNTAIFRDEEYRIIAKTEYCDFQ